MILIRIKHAKFFVHIRPMKSMLRENFTPEIFYQRKYLEEEEKGPGTYWLCMRLNYHNLSHNLTVHARKTTLQTFLSPEGKPTSFSLWSDKKRR